MHLTIEYQIAMARLADRQRQAEQAAIAGAARRDRLALASPPAYSAAGLARRVLGLIAARGRAVRDQTRPLPACPPSAPCAGCA